MILSIYWNSAENLSETRRNPAGILIDVRAAVCERIMHQLAQVSRLISDISNLQKISRCLLSVNALAEYRPLASALLLFYNFINKTGTWNVYCYHGNNSGTRYNMDYNLMSMHIYIISWLLDTILHRMYFMNAWWIGGTRLSVIKLVILTTSLFFQLIKIVMEPKARF